MPLTWCSLVPDIRTQLLELDAGLQQDVADVVDGPGVQLAEGDLQQHAVEGRDQIHVFQTVGQGLPKGQLHSTAQSTTVVNYGR